MSKGILLDEIALTVEELAHACGRTPAWVVELVESGVLAHREGDIAFWRFTSIDLARALRARQLQRDFDANLELAALVCDLIEEVERLRAQLSRSGLLFT